METKRRWRRRPQNFQYLWLGFIHLDSAYTEKDRSRHQPPALPWATTRPFPPPWSTALTLVFLLLRVSLGPSLPFRVFRVFRGSPPNPWQNQPLLSPVSSTPSAVPTTEDTEDTEEARSCPQPPPLCRGRRLPLAPATEPRATRGRPSIPRLALRAYEAFRPSNPAPILQTGLVRCEPIQEFPQVPRQRRIDYFRAGLFAATHVGKVSRAVARVKGICRSARFARKPVAQSEQR